MGPNGEGPTLRSEPGRRSAVTLLTMALTASLATGACTTHRGSGAGSGGGRAKAIPQPLVTELPVASERERVDLTMPSFSDPTTITNPLFPVSGVRSTLLLGNVDGEPFRAGPMPTELRTLSTGAAGIFDAARMGDWRSSSNAVASLTTTWHTYRTGEVPRMLDAEIGDAIDELARAIDAHDSQRASQAAIDVARVSLDLQLRHRSPAQIDLARLELWARQLLIDLAAATRARSSAIWPSSIGSATASPTLGSPDVSRIEVELGGLRVAAVAGDLVGATDAAERLRGALARLEPGS
jgi:hypothetical protein